MSPDMRRVLGDRRSVGSGVWRGRSRILSGEGCSGWPASLWLHIFPPLAAFTGLGFLSQTTQQKAQSVCYPLFPFHSHPTMVFVDMDSVHFYQFPNKTRRPGKWRSVASNLEIRNVSKERDNPVAYGPSSGQSGRLGDYDLIEYCDLTASLPEESFYPYPASVLDPKSAESHAGRTSRRLLSLMGAN